MSKKQRRDKGEGCISRRKDGKWLAILDTGIIGENGKTIKKYMYADTEGEAKKKLRECKNRYIRGERDPKKSTAREYMIDWYKNVKKPVVAKRTAERIEETMDFQIFPYIGDLQIGSVTPFDIQNMLNKLAEKGYSHSTVKKAHDYTKAVFNYAYDMEDIPRNPFKRIVVPAAQNPKKEISDIKYYTDSEVELIKKAALGKYKSGKKIYKYRYGYAVILLLNTGMRVGEMVGLQWEDIDFENKLIHVNGSAKVVKKEEMLDPDEAKYEIIYEKKGKTSSAIRTIPMNMLAMEALLYFKEICGNNKFVVSSNSTKPANIRNIDRTFRNILSNAGLTHKMYGVHSLRHTFATRLFNAGKPVEVISKLLGHSSPAITSAIYIHIIDEQKIKDIESLDDVV